MKKLTIILLLMVFLLNSVKVCGQNNDTQAALYNIGLGGFFGGVGAVINKKENEKIGKVFLKGFLQGAGGGYLVYESKKLIYKFSKHEDYSYVWGAKLLNSAGNSIIQNAASNRDFWEKWYLNIGFNRVEFTVKEKFKISYKLMPIALYGTLYSASRGNFDFETSIKTGTFVFSSNNNATIPSANVNSIVLVKGYSSKILAHELIHVYQYEDFIAINNFTNKLNEKVIVKYPFIRKLSNWIYLDSHALLLKGMYELESINNKCYFDNFFENEANYFSDRYKCN